MAMTMMTTTVDVRTRALYWTVPSSSNHWFGIILSPICRPIPIHPLFVFFFASTANKYAPTATKCNLSLLILAHFTMQCILPNSMTID